MATTSAVPLVKRQLKDTLRASVGLSGVQVTYSHPGDVQQPESVFLADARSDQDLPVSRAGRQKRSETVVVEVICAAIKPGDDAEAAENRAFELVAVVEDALADDPTLSGLATVAAKVLSLESLVYLDGSSGMWGCQVTVEIQVETRLS